MSEEQIKQFISLEQAANLCKYSQEYLSLRARQGKLRAVKIGRNWVTTREWILEYIRVTEEVKTNILNGNGKRKHVEPPANLPTEDFLWEQKIQFERPVPGLNFKLAFVPALSLLLVAGFVFGKDSMQEFAQGFDEGFKDSLVLSSSAVEDFSEGFDAGFPVAVRFISDKVAAFNEGFAYGVQAPAAVESFVSDLPAAALEVYEKANTKVEEGIKNDVDAIATTYDQVNDGIAQGLKKDISFIGSFSKKGVSIVGQGFKKVGNFAKEKFEKTAQFVLSPWIPEPQIVRVEVPVPQESEVPIEEQEVPTATSYEVVRQVVKVDDSALFEMRSQLKNVLSWQGDIDKFRQLAEKIQAGTLNTPSAVSPIYIGSTGLQVGGNINASSIGSSGPAGFQSLGVGGSATIGETNNSNSRLTVNGESTFNSVVKMNAQLSVGTSTATNLTIATSGNVETKGYVKVLDSSGTAKVTLDTNGNIAITGVLTAQGGANISGGTTTLSGLTVTGNTVLGDEATDTTEFRANTLAIPNNLNVDSNTFFINSSTDRIGLGTAVPETLLHLVLNDTGTSSITNLLTLDHTTSGTAAANFGEGISFRLENASGVLNNAAQIAALWSDATSASEDGVLTFSTSGANGGALAERMRINSAGKVGIGVTNPTGFLEVYETLTNSSNDVNGGTIFVNLPTTTTTNGTNYAIGIQTSATGQTVSSGVTDSGYRIGIRSEAYAGSGGTFAGTLANQYGIWARAGITDASSGAVVTNAYGGNFQILNRASGATITNAYGVYIDNSETVGTITNRYDLYASSANAKNYFAGNVGLGTLNPTARFQITADDATTNSILTLVNLDRTSTGTPAAGIGAGIDFRLENASGVLNNAAQIAALWSDATSASEDGVLTFSTSGANGGALAERMRIDSSGNVGIGTSPTEALEIEVNQNARTTLRLENSNAGTAARASLYAVSDNAGVALQAISSGFTTIGLVETNYGLLFSETALAGLKVFTFGSGDPLIFGTADTERVRIDGNGNVGIGTASPTSRLQVSEDSITTNSILTLLNIDRTSTGTAAAGIGNRISFRTENGSGVLNETARFDSSLSDVTSASEDTTLAFSGLLNGTMTEYLSMSSSNTIFNDSGADIDFRVEGDNATSLFVIDAGLDAAQFIPAGTRASAASATWDGFSIPATTATITGSTNITTATGFNLVNIAQPTLSAASALTVTNAATLYIANAPTGGGAGPAAITNAYALWVDNGAVRIDGNLTVSGITTNNGDVDLGDTAADTITFVGVVDSNIVADASSTRNLGSSSVRWATGYFDTVDATTLSGVVAGGSTSAATWTVNSDNATNNAEISAVAFETGSATFNSILQWNAANDSGRYAGYDNNFVANYPISLISQVSGGNQTFTSGSLFNYGQNSTHAITQTGAFVGFDADFNSNITVPNSSSGNQTGVLITLKDGGSSATAVGFQTAGTFDYGVDIGGTPGTADIRLFRGETIDNLYDAIVNVSADTLQVTNNNATTNAINSLLTLNHSTTGTVAAGFGSRISFGLENASGVLNEAARFDVSLTDATSASEDAALDLSVITGGSVVQPFRLLGDSLTMSRASGTSNMTLTVANTTDSGASHAIIDAQVGGTTSTGDPQLRLTIPSGTSWYAGVDNSETNSDTFFIGTGTAVGTNAYIDMRTDVTTAGDNLISLLYGVPTITIPSGSFNQKTGLAVAGLMVNYTGTTQVTDLNYWIQFNAPTYAGNTATLTIDKGTTVSVIAPIEGTNVSLTDSSAIRILNQGTGVPTNQYGLYVESLTSGTNDYGIYIAGADTNAIWVDAGDVRFDANLVVGGSTSTTETLANSGFVMGGDDLFVAGLAGIEGNVYTDGSFIAGATTTYSDGSITTSGATFNLVNATATTVNLAGAATTLSIGANTGTTTINNALTVTGAITFNGYSTFTTPSTFTWNDSSTNTVTTLLNLDRSTTGTAAAGIGERIAFRLENASGVLNESAQFNVSLSTATSGSEDSVIAFSNFVDGTLAERMRIDGAGNVGIGTAAPQSLLDVQGPTGTGATGAGILTLATKELTIVDGDELGRINFNAPLESDGSDAILAGAAIWAEADDTFSATVNSTELVFGTATTSAAVERMRIDSAGNVGIGTASPSALLDIAGDVSFPNSANRTISVATTTSGTANSYSLTIAGGNSTGSGWTGGNLVLKAGTATDTGSNNIGGNVTITGGQVGGGTTNGGGAVTIQGGGTTANTPVTGLVINANGTTTISSSTNIGGNITLTSSADRTISIDTLSGTAHDRLLTIKGSENTNGSGWRAGDVLIQGGTVAAGTGGFGGDVFLRAGSAGAGNTAGTVQLQTSDGTARLYLDTTGNVGIGDTSPDALLDLDSTDTDGGDFLITNTGVGLSGTVAGITSNSTTTGDILTISATGLTTGTAVTLTGPSSTGVTDHFVKITADVGSASSLLNLNPDFSGSAVTGYGIYNTATDATANGNTDYGYYGSLALTGNAAKTGYGIYQTVTSSSTTADTLYSLYSTSSVTGIITSGTRNVYGVYSNPTAGAESTGGTTNVYGGYYKTDADVAAGGTVNGYGLYIANGTFDTDGTSTQTGLYVESLTGADTNYAAIFAGGNVGINTTAPQSLLDVQGAAGAAGILTLATKELTVVDGDVLGRIDFNAPLESDGSDAILVGASIWAEADDTFSTTVNSTELVFATGTTAAATEKMRIDRDGNVGIGTASPSTLFHVDGGTGNGDFKVGLQGNLDIDFVYVPPYSQTVIDISSTGSINAPKFIDITDTSGDNSVGYGIRITSTGNRNTWYSLYSDTSSIVTSDVYGVYQTGSTAKNYFQGNVGIGDTGPDSLLDILSATTGTNIIITNTNGTDTDVTIGFALAEGTNTFTMGVDDSDSDKFKISTTALGTNDRFVIDSSGNVGIGTTTPDSLLHIVGRTCLEVSETACDSNSAALRVGSNDSSTNSILTLANLDRTTTGTAAAGIGERIAFRIENASDVLNESARFDVSLSDATSASEDTIIAFNGMLAGTMTEFLSLNTATGGPVSVFNESGADIDFRIESDTNANILMIDAGLETMGIGAAAISASQLLVSHTTADIGAHVGVNNLLTINQSGASNAAVQRGFYSRFAFNTDVQEHTATVGLRGYDTSFTDAGNSSSHVTGAAHYYATNAVFNFASITNQYGVYVEALTEGTNNYGLYINTPTGTIARAIQTTGGDVMFGSAGTSAQVFSALGTASLPGYSFHSSGTTDPNTGMFSSGADTVNFATGGTERSRITSAGATFINDGTTTTIPSTITDIFGTGLGLAIMRPTTNSQVVLIETGADAQGGVIGFMKTRATDGTPTSAVQSGDIIANISARGSGTSAWGNSSRIRMEADATFTNTSTPGRLVFMTTATSATDSTERMRIDSAGNVGIGDTSPASLLTVGSGDLFQVNSLGFVGVGRTPLVPVDVVNNGSNTSGIGQLLRLDQTTTGTAAAGFGSRISFGLENASDVLNESAQFNVSLSTATSGSEDSVIAFSNFVDGTLAERMRIDGTGNVGIGTTSPGAALEITGNLLFTKEAARTITVATSTTANTAGGALSIAAGQASGTGTGGALTITGGAATSTGDSKGGSVTIAGGAAFGGSTSTAGSVTIAGGDATGGSGDQGSAGNLTLRGGNAAGITGGNVGGNVTITGGDNNITTGSSITITSGRITNTVVAATGLVSISTPNGNENNSTGAISLTTGNAGANGNSGTLTLTTGTATSGTVGSLLFKTAGTERMRVEGDGDVRLGDGTTDTHTLSVNAGGAVVFNENSADIDFRIESDTNANMFVIDAGTNTVGIGDASPVSLLTVGSGDLFQVNSLGFVGVGRTPLVPVDVVNNGSNTSGIGQLLRLDQTTTGTAAAGFGSRISFGLENASAVLNESARFDVSLSDATSASEDTIIAFNGMLAGTMTEFLSLNTATGGPVSVFNESGADIDFRVEGDNNANLFTLDAGTDSLALGGTVTSGSFLTLADNTQARTLITSVGYGIHEATSTMTDNGGARTVAIGARNFLGTPTITNASSAVTFTRAANLYIAGPATAGTNVTLSRAYSLHVNDGVSLIGVNGSSGGSVLSPNLAASIAPLIVSANLSTDDIGGLALWNSRDDSVAGKGPSVMFYNTRGSGVIDRLAYIRSTNTTDGNTGNLIFATVDVEAMRIDSSQRVGIGDTSPASLLTVGSGDLFQVNSLGFVGVGRTPLVPVDVVNNGSNTSGIGQLLRLDQTTTGTAAAGFGSRISFGLENASDVLNESAQFNVSLSTATSGSEDSVIAFSNFVDGTLAERMRIDGDGEVGIGITSPAYTLDLSTANTTITRLASTNTSTDSVLIHRNAARTVSAYSQLEIRDGTTTSAYLKAGAYGGNNGEDSFRIEGPSGSYFEMFPNKGVELNLAGALTNATMGFGVKAATLSNFGSSENTSAIGYMSVGALTMTATSPVTWTNIAGLYVAAAPAAGANVTLTNSYALWVDAGTTRLDGNVGIGTTAPYDTLGLTINQGTADNQILNLVSSDVAHGRTQLAETDTFANFTKLSATEGGLELRAVRSTGNEGLLLRGTSTDGDTTKGTSSVGKISIMGTRGTGSGDGGVNPNENLLAIQDHSGTRAIFDVEGDLYQAGLFYPGAGSLMQTSSYISGTSTGIGIGTTSPTARFQVVEDSATTNSILTLLNIDRTTTGTAAAGIGERIAFRLENASGVLNESARFDVSLTDATSASEDAALDLSVITGGSVVQPFRLLGDSLTMSRASSTANMTLTVANTTDSGASHAIIDAQVGGTTSTGDPQLRLTIPSGTSWYAGVDNSDAALLDAGDPFIIGTGTTVGSNAFLTIRSVGTFQVSGAIYSFGNTANTAVEGSGSKMDVVSLPSKTYTFSAGGSPYTALQAALRVQALTLSTSGGDSTIQKATGIEVTAPQGASTSIVTDSSAIRVLNTGAGGTQTNQYGLYIESLTTATNDYGIYIAGADTNAIWVDSGTSRFDGQIFAELGTAGAPAYSFVSSGTTDPDTGMWSPAANTIAFSTGGSERVRIDSSGDVGINTTTPGLGGVAGRGYLTVAGTANAVAVLELQNPSATANAGLGSVIFFSGTDDVASLSSEADGATDSGRLLFTTQSSGGSRTERMRIDSSGNVGIGSTSPVARLQVVEDGVTTNSILTLLNLDRTSTGTPAAGIGNRIAFRLENASAVLNEAARFDVSLSDATSASEDTIIAFNGMLAGSMTEFLSLNTATGGPVSVFNESGADIDFRVEGDTITNLFHVDAALDTIGIGTAPVATQTVKTSRTFTDFSTSAYVMGMHSVINGSQTAGGANYGLTVAGVEADAQIAATNTKSYTGTIGLAGFVSYLETTAGSTGTVTGAAHFATFSDMVEDGATVTNQYGLYIHNLTKGDNDYGIYIAGADTNPLYINHADASNSDAIYINTEESTTTQAVFSIESDTATGSGADTLKFKITADGSVYSDSNTYSTPADLAEMYYFTGDIEAGDIVSVTEITSETFEDGVRFAVQRAISDDQGSLVGVISTKPGPVIGYDWNNPEKIAKQKPVALAGRVPVRVNTENGPIEVGDSITASSVPGVGMKATSAGMVVGTALESFDGAGEQKIEILISLHWQGNDLSVSQDREGNLVNLDPEELRSGLSALGLEVSPNGTLALDTLRARKVVLERLELKDQRNGDIYCTWIDNGEWVKVRSECDTVAIPDSTGNAPSPDVPSDSSSTTSSSESTSSPTTPDSSSVTFSADAGAGSDSSSSTTSTDTTSPSQDGISTTTTSSLSEDGVSP